MRRPRPGRRERLWSVLEALNRLRLPPQGDVAPPHLLLAAAAGLRELTGDDALLRDSPEAAVRALEALAAAWRPAGSHRDLVAAVDAVVDACFGAPSARLAVYGSLAPGKANAHMLHPLAGTWSDGFVRGTLHADGWGSTIGFSALVLSADGPMVPVRLFESEELRAHWQRLDDFEGPEYHRSLAAVTMPDGGVRIANLYALRG